MKIDWGKPGWIMVALWIIGAIVVAATHPLYSLFFLAFALLRAWIVYQDPKGY